MIPRVMASWRRDVDLYLRYCIVVPKQSIDARFRRSIPVLEERRQATSKMEFDGYRRSRWPAGRPQD
jgi:hypothetical protein